MHLLSNPADARRLLRGKSGADQRIEIVAPRYHYGN